MISQRGQTSIELVISIVFVLFILVIVSVLALQKTNESNSLKTQIYGKGVCNSFASNINTIATQGNGFYKYFSVPARMYNREEYNISVYGNWAEIDYGNYSWITQLITSNVTMVCLDKGAEYKNKVFNDNERIYITCHRPELIFLTGSLRPKTASRGENINVSVKIMNFGPVDSEAFTILYNNTIPIPVSPLESEEQRLINFSVVAPPEKGTIPIELVLDSGGVINESIESNNLYNGTIEII